MDFVLMPGVGDRKYMPYLAPGGPHALSMCEYLEYLLHFVKVALYKLMKWYSSQDG